MLSNHTSVDPCFLLLWRVIKQWRSGLCIRLSIDSRSERNQRTEVKVKLKVWILDISLLT